MDYQGALKLLEHGSTGRTMPRKKIANNTYARLEEDGRVIIRLHATDILEFSPAGTVRFDSGGWLTVTTKARMNDYGAPFRFHADKGTWKVSAILEDGYYVRADGTRLESWELGAEYVPSRWSVTAPYFDGMELRPADPRGSLEEILGGADALHALELLEHDKAMKRRIAAYARGYTEEECRRLYDDAAQNGTAGDCWYCLMRGEDGTTLGDSSASHEHLISHIEEDYRMASLAINALEECGYRVPAVILAHSRSSVPRAIRRYLEARLLVGASSGRRMSAARSEGFA